MGSMKEKSPAENTRFILETLMETLTPTNRLCRVDAQAAIIVAKTAKICTSGQVIHIPGPIKIFYLPKNRVATFDFHSVAELDNHWIVDIAQLPGNRVYDGLKDYRKKAILV